MTLTDALSHPWLLGYDPNTAYGEQQPVFRSQSPNGLPDADASMRSVMPGDSMAMDAEPSQPGHVPGAFPPINNASGLVRRSDIVLNSDEDKKIFSPSQEMIEHAEQEESRFYSATGQSRPNKRKSAPLDFEASLTPMPEETGEDEGFGDDQEAVQKEDAEPDGDQQMADIDVHNARPKRTKAAPRSVTPKPARGAGGEVNAGAARSCRRGRHVLDEEAALPPPSPIRAARAHVVPAQKPRRSTRLTQSPQKAGRK